ncbi:hypothetical protein N9595_02640 [Bacteroidia bacterium]|nr:hypothetical protein [Bacteroidia bacterium]
MLFWGYACKRVEQPLPIGPDYFPLQIGKFITYSTQEITHNASSESSDTANFLIRKTVERSIQDGTKNIVYVIAVETSTDSGNSWNFIRYNTVKKDAYNVQIVANDIRKVKLSFPFKERKTWDANQLNSSHYQRATLLNIDKSNNVANKLFEYTATVELGNDEDLFFTDVETELYAKGIGLILSKLIDLERQPGKYLQGKEHFNTIYETNW